MALLNWLESNAYAQWILTSAWGWPIMLSLHAFGLAIILGVMFAMNLRVLGWYRTLPLTSLHTLMGIAWIGIWINIFSGVSVFLTRPAEFLGSIPFLLKISCIAAGIVILVYTRKMLTQEAHTWGTDAPPLARQLAMGSLVFWVLAVVAGRLIAYVDVG